MEDVVVSGVALTKNEAKITIFKVPDRPGVAAKIFKRLADDDINVDMIIQNKTATKTTDISFTIFKNQYRQAMDSVQRAARAVQAKSVHCDQDIAKVSVVGIGMRSHSGVASKMFDALAKNKVNIQMISTSEIKISCVVPGKKGKIATRAIHRAFGLGKR